MIIDINDCPPRMSDGRHFTDFRPNCTINNMLRVQNKVANSYEYRMFLTRNADSNYRQQMKLMLWIKTPVNHVTKLCSLNKQC